MAATRSVDGLPIRLPDERWDHIRERHGELASFRAHILETVASPDRVVAGDYGERLALREVEPGQASRRRVPRAWVVDEGDDIIMRYDGDQIIGFTVLHAEARAA